MIIIALNDRENLRLEKVWMCLFSSHLFSLKQKICDITMYKTGNFGMNDVYMELGLWSVKWEGEWNFHWNQNLNLIINRNFVGHAVGGCNNFFHERLPYWSIVYINCWLISYSQTFIKRSPTGNGGMTA